MEEVPPMTVFTEFERDSSATVGVMFKDFVTAVGMFVYTNQAARSVTVADVALAFNTTPEVVREAVAEHYWLGTSDDADPAKQVIESDGE
jgi:hypothetical protein